VVDLIQIPVDKRRAGFTVIGIVVRVAGIHIGMVAADAVSSPANNVLPCFIAFAGYAPEAMSRQLWLKMMAFAACLRQLQLLRNRPVFLIGE